MKRYFLPLLLFSAFSLVTACEPEGPGDKEPEPPVAEEIIEIPDEHFKYALVSTNSIDTNGDNLGDSDLDLNDDGEVQRSEAELVEGLIIDFQSPENPVTIDLTGIENFVNLKYIKMTGFVYSEIEETPVDEFITYDFTALKRLEYLELNNMATYFMELLDLSGLSNLTEVNLINNMPGYDGYTDANYPDTINLMNVNFEGCTGLTTLNIYNSYLVINFCQVPSLKKLNMRYLEGGEPDVFDFHCLANLEWLDISENRINTLILKNSSVLETLLVNDIGASDIGNYPFLDYICIDNIPEEYEQISTLIDEDTVVVTDCTF